MSKVFTSSCLARPFGRTRPLCPMKGEKLSNSEDLLSLSTIISSLHNTTQAVLVRKVSVLQALLHLDRYLIHLLLRDH